MTYKFCLSDSDIHIYFISCQTLAYLAIIRTYTSACFHLYSDILCANLADNQSVHSTSTPFLSLALTPSLHMACCTQAGSALVKDATTDEAADLISAEETPHDHDHPPVAEEVLSPTKEADFDDDNQVIMHEEGEEDDDDAGEKYKLKEENTEEKAAAAAAAAAPPITIGDEDEPTDHHTLNPDAEAEEDDDGEDMI